MSKKSGFEMPNSLAFGKWAANIPLEGRGTRVRGSSGRRSRRGAAARGRGLGPGTEPSDGRGGSPVTGPRGRGSDARHREGVSRVGSPARGGWKAPAGHLSRVEGARLRRPLGVGAVSIGSNDGGGHPASEDHGSVTRASGRAERVRIAGDRVKGCSGGSFHRSWRNVELVSAGSAGAAAAISRACSQARRRRQGRAEAADGPGSVDTAEAHVPSTRLRLRSESTAPVRRWPA